MVMTGGWFTIVLPTLLGFDIVLCLLFHIFSTWRPSHTPDLRATKLPQFGKHQRDHPVCRITTFAGYLYIHNTIMYIICYIV